MRAPWRDRDWYRWNVVKNTTMTKVDPQHLARVIGERRRRQLFPDGHAGHTFDRRPIEAQ